MMTVVATAVQGFEEKYAFYRNIFLFQLINIFFC